MKKVTRKISEGIDHYPEHRRDWEFSAGIRDNDLSLRKFPGDFFHITHNLCHFKI